MFGEPVAPDVPGLDRFQGTIFHSARLGRRPRPQRRASRGHRQRGERGAAHPRDRADRRLARPSTSEPRTGCPRRTTTRTPRRSSRRSPRRPDALQASREEIFTTIDPNLTFADPERRALYEKLRAAQHRGWSRTTELRARAHPGRAVRVQAAAGVEPLLPHVQPAARRARHRRRSPRSPSTAIVTADGTTRRVDTIILATGFTTTKFLAALDVVGRNGVDIDDAWADGAAGVPGHHHRRLPEPVHALRPEHQQRVDHLHDRVPGRLRHARCSTHGRHDLAVGRREARRDGRVQRGVPASARRASRCGRPGATATTGSVGRIVTQWPGSMSRVPRPHRRASISTRTRSSPPSRVVGFGPWTSASPSPTPVATRHPSGCASTAPPPSSSGFDSLWGVDHLVMPQHTESDYTLGRKPAKIADDAVSGLLSPNYEMMTTLTWVAGFTERVQLGTAVAVLPIRNAVHNARALATLDVYSGGRVALRRRASGGCARRPRRWACPGTAAAPAARSTSRCCARCGARTATSSSSTASSTTSRRWTPSHGRCSGPIPILIGGHSDVALRTCRSHRRRVDRRADVARTGRRALAQGAASGRAQRARSRTSLQLFTSTSVRVDLPLGDLLAQYREIGVDHVLVGLHRQSPRGDPRHDP